MYLGTLYLGLLVKIRVRVRFGRAVDFQRLFSLFPKLLSVVNKKDLEPFFLLFFVLQGCHVLCLFLFCSYCLLSFLLIFSNAFLSSLFSFSFPFPCLLSFFPLLLLLSFVITIALSHFALLLCSYFLAFHPTTFCMFLCILPYYFAQCFVAFCLLASRLILSAYFMSHQHILNVKDIKSFL